MAEAEHMQRAIALSLEMMRSGRGGPFGAVVVKDGSIIAEGFNQVTSTNDPTAHAEVVALRLACQALGTFDLTGCEIYTSCEPCPMCLSAIYWARFSRIYFANDRHDAAKIGFRDDFLYHEIPLPLDQRAIPTSRLLQAEGWAAFEEWDRKPDKIAYQPDKIAYQIATGLSVVFVTYLPEEAIFLAEPGFVMSPGPERIVSEGRTILEWPWDVSSSEFNDIRRHPACLQHGGHARVTA